MKFDEDHHLLTEILEKDEIPVFWHDGKYYDRNKYKKKNNKSTNR